MTWNPPGIDCGQCGEQSCADLIKKIEDRMKLKSACPYYREEDQKEDPIAEINKTEYSNLDVLGKEYDFILKAFPGEISARKIILPFRPDLVEKWQVKPGDLVMGRPTGAGCPVPHIIKVLKAEYNTGLITGHVTGPKEVREGKPYHDFGSYHMIGFEGIATQIKREPSFGNRVMFLPGFCMMNVAHTGLVNFMVKTGNRIEVRIENILILNHT